MQVAAADVKLIIKTSLPDDTVERMILTADRLLIQHIDPAGTVSNDMRDEIQMYVAAHFCAIRDRQAKTQSADGVNFVMDGGNKEGMVGLMETFWGRQAIMLDPSGALAKLNTPSRKRLRFNFSNDHEDTEV